ncbi:MAG: JAB domain-containing protein [Acidimicrobiales bacterium]
MEFFESEPLFSSKLRDEPDWALVERITGKKCPETVSLRNLSRMTQTELKETLGLTDVQGKKLGAALILGERLANEAIERGMSINNAKDVFRIFRGQMKDAKKEGFYAVTLDQKHQAIDIHQISEGSLSMTLVHPREAFNPVIRDSAAAVIFMHNHPSGNPEPSKDDHMLTARLAEAGKLLGIRVLDHVVIGDRAFSSLRDLGAIGEERGMESFRAAENYGCREALQAREELPEGKVTTAILRTRALEAERNRDWRKAAECYRMAIENYPSHHSNSALAIRDIDSLTGSMKECLRMEASEKGLSHSSPQAREEKSVAPPIVRQRSRDGMGF